MADDGHPQDQDPNEVDLDAHIRRHFRAARASVSAPGFETVIFKAEAAQAQGSSAAEASSPAMSWLRQFLRGFRQQPIWAGAVTAALVLTMALLMNPASAPESEPAAAPNLAAHLPVAATVIEGELLASLSRGTRWQAPSDRWLSTGTNIDIYRLPDLSDPEALKEKTLWL